MTKIKVCGLRSLEDIQCVNKYKPDYIGFIFVEGRKRYISPDEALKLKEKLSSEIRSVGVFLDDEIEKIVNITDRGIIDMIQLHGHESEDFIANLRKRTDKKIIKAFSVKSEDDIENAVKSSADYVMLDNGIGGTGETFNWDLCKNINRDFFVAGGLNKDNVLDIIDFAKPYAVDVSSGVETDGVKDYAKIEAFVDKVRNHERVSVD